MPLDGRIPFRLRIGVIGHRSVPESDGLREAIREALERAITESGYSAVPRPSTPLTLTVVSALAEGADRLVVREVLRCWPGSKLICVLPVLSDNLPSYLADFELEDSRQEFRSLYDSAWLRIFPRPGMVPRDTGQAGRDAGYLWAGQEVARNCDVLVALWDEQPPRGTGGTADLIYRLRENDRQLSGTGEPPFFPSDAGPLRIVVSTTGNHDVLVDDKPPGDASAIVVRKQLASDLRDLDRLNRTPIPAADWRQSAEQIANDLGSAEYRHWPRLNDIFRQITPVLIRADRAAIAAHKRFLRFSYALYLCTAAATIVAALQAIVFTGIWQLTIGEIALLAGSVVIVAAERHWKNHERWFACRFLAERLRGAFYLLAVGVNPHTGPDTGWTPEDPARNGWTRRAFAEVIAEQRAEHEEPSEPLKVLSSLVRDYWLDGQIRYFTSASRKMTRMHRMVLTSLYIVLCVTIAVALVHSLRIWPFHSVRTQFLVMCAIGLPAAAGALSNIRSLREFSRHSLRYARVANALRWYMRQFGHELSIHDLQELAANIDTVLTAEARGWLGVVSERGLELHG
jgi:hypothetical protein